MVVGILLTWPTIKYGFRSWVPCERQAAWEIGCCPLTSGLSSLGTMPSGGLQNGSAIGPGSMAVGGRVSSREHVEFHKNSGAGFLLILLSCTCPGE